MLSCFSIESVLGCHDEFSAVSASTRSRIAMQTACELPAQVLTPTNIEVERVLGYGHGDTER
eukprot:1651367-Pyramimonas_sp.AAC.1